MKIAYIGIDMLYPALLSLAGNCEIMEVFTCETDNVTEFNLQVCAFAREHKIPLTVGKIKREDIVRLKKNGCDVVVCGGYYHYIPVDDTLPMVNIHHSLLPIGRGAWPMPATILRGLPESGVTVHKITKDFDEGDILLQERVLVAPKENLRTLTAKQLALLPDMMKRLVTEFDLLWGQAVPQGKGEYWSCPMESDYPITEHMSTVEADLILRAFYGYECIYQIQDKQYGLVGGVLHSDENTRDHRFPVQSGFIEAEQVKEL